MAFDPFTANNVAYFRIHDPDTDIDYLLSSRAEETDELKTLTTDGNGEVYVVYVDGTEELTNYWHMDDYFANRGDVYVAADVTLVQPEYVDERLTAATDVLKAIADPLVDMVSGEQKTAIEDALANLENVINQAG